MLSLHLLQPGPTISLLVFETGIKRASSLPFPNGSNFALESGSEHPREEIERRACETNAIGNGRKSQYKHQIPLGP